MGPVEQGALTLLNPSACALLPPPHRRVLTSPALKSERMRGRGAHTDDGVLRRSERVRGGSSGSRHCRAVAPHGDPTGGCLSSSKHTARSVGDTPAGVPVLGDDRALAAIRVTVHRACSNAAQCTPYARRPVSDVFHWGPPHRRGRAMVARSSSAPENDGSRQLLLGSLRRLYFFNIPRGAESRRETQSLKEDGGNRYDTG